MRFLAIGDLHGKIPRNLKNFVEEEKIDFIICLGDLGEDLEMTNLIFRHWMKRRWYEVVGIKKANKLLRKCFSSAIKILKFFNSFDIPVYLIFGNGDLYEMKGKRPKYRKFRIKTPSYEVFVKKFQNLIFIHKRMIKIKNLNIVGHGGYVDPTIYLNQKILKENKEDYLERKERYNRTQKEINSIFKKNPGKFIFVTHYPPFGKLDLIGNKKSPLYKKHAGLQTYSQIDRKYQPLLHIFGHMHENQGIEKIGKTLVVNPGYGRAGECALIDLNDSKINVKFLKL